MFLYHDIFGPGADARTPKAFRRSLGFFNLYRLLIATFFLVATLFYDAAPAFGARDSEAFMHVCAGYVLIAVVFFAWPAWLRERFNLTLTAGVLADIIALTVMMHYSDGPRSGFGYMLLFVLAAAGLVGQGRLTLFHASLASLAVLLEQSYRVLSGAAEATEFFHAGVLSLGFFGTAITARLLSIRIIANEELARRRGAELEAQWQINQRVIRDMQDGVLVVGTQGQVIQYNPQAASLFLVAESGVDTLEVFSSALAERYRQWVGRGLDSEELIRVAGGQRLLRVRFLPPGEAGNALLYVEDMERLQAQTQQVKLAALGRLAANMAHEIRNPLAAISHASELLREEQGLGTNARLTRIINDNTERLNRIVGDVLELGRRDRAAPEQIRVAEFIGMLLDELALNDATWHEIVAVSVSTGLELRFDRGHLHRVLANLLGNARRYCSGNTGAIRIEAYLNDNEHTELHLMDDGPGIGESMRNQIFEPFFTTHSGGTGLGLYIARELCEANGALLQLGDNTPGAHFRLMSWS